jgi:hypothetical protein
MAFLKFLGATPNSSISLRDALLAFGCGDLFKNLLEPFLRGVFLAELESVDSAYGRDIIKSFVVGDSGLPAAGVGTLSEAIAARIENIHLNSPVNSLEQFAGKKIVVATDSITASKLLGTLSEANFADTHTWYHSLPAGVIESKRLRVTSAKSPIVNSISLSNVVPEYAPGSQTLISTTTLASLSDDAIATELSKFWGIDSSQFNLVKHYEINNSLPIFAPSQVGITSAQVRENVYRAGDYMTAGSQNGALLSGRLAAQELLTH